MTRDHRTRLVSRGEELHREREFERRRLLEASISEEEWRKFTDPLFHLVLGSIGGGDVTDVSLGLDVDPGHRNSFEGILNRFRDRRAFLSEDDFGYVLIRRLAKLLAESLPVRVGLWTSAADLFRFCENWALFVESIPVGNLEACTGDLIYSPSSAAHCFDDDLVSKRHRSWEVEQAEAEPLRILWDRARIADYCSLNSECQFRSAVLSRVSASRWRQWLEGLPDPVTQLVALNAIGDVGFLESVLEDLANRPAELPAERLLLSVVWRMICLWEEIEDGISQAVRLNYEEAEERREQWVSAELPLRVQRLVRVLSSSSEGHEAASQLLCHLSPYRGFPLVKLPSRDLLRDELLNYFVERGDALENTGLLEAPSKNSLAVSGYLALRHSDSSQLGQVFSAYAGWLCSETQAWYQHFEEPDKELLGILSEVLSKSPDALDDAKNLINRVKKPAQGWKFSYGLWLSSIPRLSHALVVVGLAAVHAANGEGRGEKSSGLMKMAWDEFHAMLEDGCTEPRKSMVQSPLAYIWACARTALDVPEGEIQRALRILGDPTLVVVAAENFSSNGGLTAETKAFVEHEVAQLIGLYRYARNFSEQYARTLRESVGKLATTTSAV